MRKTIYGLWVMIAMFCMLSCDDYETYGEKKETERDAIAEFIRDSSITVITEAQFEKQGQTTNVGKNEYVFLGKSGVYMQIVRKGCGKPLEEDRQVNLLCRYSEYNIIDKYYQTRNDYSPRNPEKMTVQRDGSSFTATFANGGIMYSTYGASVPAGWLVPLLYINVGRQTNPNEEIAMVRIIVPHTKGHSYASSSVYPCFYTITYQREK